MQLVSAGFCHPYKLHHTIVLASEVMLMLVLQTLVFLNHLSAYSTHWFVDDLNCFGGLGASMKLTFVGGCGHAWRGANPMLYLVKIIVLFVQSTRLYASWVEVSVL